MSESTTLLSNEHCSLTLTNTGANYFLATCFSHGASTSARVTPETITSTHYSDSNTDHRPSSFDSLLRYLRQQLLPIHSECVKVSSDMQDTFGFIPYTLASMAYRSKRTDDTFVIDNATTISKLTDMLNVHLHDCLGALVLQGEDGEYGMASSFDLLQQAIVVQQLGCVPAGDRDLVRAKKEILERLRTDMTAHYESAATCNGHGSICSSLWLERAYDIYCAAFRSYLLRNYATFTQDLRFHNANTVLADSMLVRQGTSHWKASRLMSGECETSATQSDKTCVNEMMSLQLANTPLVPIAI
jgi:hypothetical protein